MSIVTVAEETTILLLGLEVVDARYAPGQMEFSLRRGQHITLKRLVIARPGTIEHHYIRVVENARPVISRMIIIFFALHVTMTVIRM